VDFSQTANTWWQSASNQLIGRTHQALVHPSAGSAAMFCARVTRIVLAVVALRAIGTRRAKSEERIRPSINARRDKHYYDSGCAGNRNRWDVRVAH
jgi:hypothetical protein